MDKGVDSLPCIEAEFPAFHSPDEPGAALNLRVRFQAAALGELLRHAETDYRLFELISLARPGDMCAYVQVELVSPAASLTARVPEHIVETNDAVATLLGSRPLRFCDFDELFASQGEESSSTADRWVHWRKGNELRTYLGDLLKVVQAAVSTISMRSALAAHVFRRIELNEHEFCFLPRNEAIEASRDEFFPHPSCVSEGFATQLLALLSKPNIHSVALYGEALDWTATRLACTEQRRRAEISGEISTFEIGAFLGADGFPPREWEARIRVQMEGLPSCDLWVDLGWEDRPLRSWRASKRCRIVICTTDAGELPGYVKTTGDGWTMYTAEQAHDGTTANGQQEATKTLRYRVLVEERKKCRACPGLVNPAAVPLRRFDGDQIGPWTRWQGDLDARVMVVGQDWGGHVNFLRQNGRDQASVTNANLRGLLGVLGFPVDLPSNERTETGRGVFLTNAVLCIKDGPDNGNVSPRFFAQCGRGFLKRQIELVSPELVVCLGYEAYRATLLAFDRRPEATLREAMRSHPILTLGNGLMIAPVFHCGNLGRRARGREAQLSDWKNLAEALAQRNA